MSKKYESKFVGLSYAYGIFNILQYVNPVLVMILTFINGPEGHKFYFLSLLVAQVGTFLNLWHQHLFAENPTALDDAIIVSVLTALFLIGYSRIKSRL